MLLAIVMGKQLVFVNDLKIMIFLTTTQQQWTSSNCSVGNQET